MLSMLGRKSPIKTANNSCEFTFRFFRCYDVKKIRISTCFFYGTTCVSS